MKLRFIYLIYALGFYLLTFLFSGCASKQPSVIYIPAGIDTTIAMVSDSVAKEIFVKWSDEQRAKRLLDSARVFFDKSEEIWNALESKQQTTATSLEDSIAALRKFVVAYKEMKNLGPTMRDSTLSLIEKKDAVRELFERAQIELEESILLNPFDMRARNMLARTYERLADRFEQDQYWGKAAEAISKLLQMDQSQHTLYARLGSAYAQLGAWERALNHYMIAEEVLRGSAIFEIEPEAVARNAQLSMKNSPDVDLDTSYVAEFPPDSAAMAAQKDSLINNIITDEMIAAALDSSLLFTYVVKQAEANMRLYNEKDTFDKLNLAFEIAKDENQREFVQGYYDWAMWDEGNLQAADMKDTLISYINSSRFAEAAEGLTNLIPNLRSARATQEMKWRLAVVEFRNLNQEEAGITIMHEIVDFYQKDSTGMALAKTDSNLTRYLNAYGTACLNLGAKMRDEVRDRTKALMYFEQAAAITWDNQARAYLAIAQLALQNPVHCEHAAKEALKLREQITQKEYVGALKALIAALRRQRKFDEAAKYFKELQWELQNAEG